MSDPCCKIQRYSTVHAQNEHEHVFACKQLQAIARIMTSFLDREAADADIDHQLTDEESILDGESVGTPSPPKSKRKHKKKRPRPLSSDSEPESVENSITSEENLMAEVKKRVMRG